jgi:hypothetical protein
MLPPLPRFFAERERVVRWQNGRKKLGERAGVRGSFWTAATRSVAQQELRSTLVEAAEGLTLSDVEGRSILDSIRKEFLN